MRSWFGCVFGLLLLVVTFVMVELSFRVYHHFFPTVFFSEKTYNRFRALPYSIGGESVVNSKGFHDREHSANKNPGVYRVVALGDSCVFGVVPLPHHFLNVLADQFDQKGQRVECVNMGVPGAAVQDYEELLKDEGFGMQPDLVLVGVFIGNDFGEAPKYVQSKIFAIRFFQYLIHVLPLKKSSTEYLTEYQDNEATLDRGRFYEIEGERSWVFQKAAGSAKRLDEAVGHVSETLDRMRNACQARDISFLVLLIPSEIQVSETLQNTVTQQAIKKSIGDYDFEQPNRALCLALEAKGIQFIDLYSDFYTHSKSSVLYKPFDTHWNIRGNHLAGQILFEKLSTMVDNTGS